MAQNKKLNFTAQFHAKVLFLSARITNCATHDFAHVRKKNILSRVEKKEKKKSLIIRDKQNATKVSEERNMPTATQRRHKTECIFSAKETSSIWTSWPNLEF